MKLVTLIGQLKWVKLVLPEDFEKRVCGINLELGFQSLVQLRVFELIVMGHVVYRFLAWMDRLNELVLHFDSRYLIRALEVVFFFGLVAFDNYYPIFKNGSVYFYLSN